MEMNRVGKFEVRRIINEIDSVLIEWYGVNMLDAKISREEALRAYNETGSARRAADLCAGRRGLAPPGSPPIG